MITVGEPSASKSSLLRRLIWLYFWFLIFEGALRKWILPQFSTPLLIVRDPVLLLIYGVALQSRQFPKSGFVTAAIVLGVLALGATLVGLASDQIQSTLIVTFFGFRASFLHLPLIFLMGEVFTRRDVEAVGKWCLIIAPAMAVLVFLQFQSSPSAWVNCGAGGSENGQIGVAGGGADKIRPPGMFSFNTGLASYLTFLSAFLFHHFLKTKVYTRSLVIAAAISLATMAAFSISRSSMASLVIVAAAVLVASLSRAEFIRPAGRILFCALLISLILGSCSTIREGVSILQARVIEANGIKVGLFQRFFSEQLVVFEVATSAPFVGYGLGKGTNAGASILTGGERNFLLTEGEWCRLVLEMGPVLGFAYIGLRCGIAFRLARLALQQTHEGRALPLLLCSACFLPLIEGSFGQPTALGFAIFGGGLCLASVSDRRDAGERRDDLMPGKKNLATEVVHQVRGRSVYAEALHGRGAS
jgi:hypothetical protein